MKNEILIVSLLFVFILAGSVSAAEKGNQPEVKGQQQATQTSNQGQETELQENIQIRVTDNQGNNIQVREQEQLRDGSEAGSQVQNQGENNQIQNNSGENSSQRRSNVANAVQQMLQVSERNGGIGEQVRVLAQNQNQNQVELEDALSKVEKRNNFTKFFIGSDFKAINSAEAILEQSNQQIQELIQVKNQLENASDQQILEEQIQLLESVNSEVENVLNNSQKGFSLLGWMFKLFSN